jgi:hypothetical protein
LIPIKPILRGKNLGPSVLHDPESSVSDPDPNPHSMGSWIQKGKNLPQKEEKVTQNRTEKDMKISTGIFYGVIF